MKKRRLHCSHAYHMLHCTCGHVRYVHVDLEGLGQESGRCTIRKCLCEQFSTRPGYTDEQLTHDTIPIEGYQKESRSKSGDFI